ncbi:hypothetical protein GBAR_LOCUS1846 [Geodia barretti]|uniref:PWWP domain-containing protein n=1 Tax=Geodia barretti TaxID=519541 RepID=A0AA35W5V9_GEOBA|nr:hypothetical protein GBAR_LOCUS1846 [Geodia barretti]
MRFVRMRSDFKMAATAGESWGKEERDTVCDYRAGQPVWYRNDKKTGWWPCMVLQVSEDGERRSVDLKALGDNYPYGWVKIGLPQLKPFVSPDCQSIVQEQIKRLQKKHKTDLRNFVAAVREALQHFPLSTFDVELPSDRELDEIATPVPTPQPARVWRPFLHDSEIFTPGTDSRGDTGGSVTRSQRRLRQRPTTPVQCQSVPLTSTAEKAKSDILPKVVRRRSGQKKRRQCSMSPYSSEKRSKIDEEEEGGRSGADCDVRRRLDLEESMDDAVVDILTICESSGGDMRECEVGRGEGRENGESGERGVCGGAEQNGTSGRECRGWQSVEEFGSNLDTGQRERGNASW